MRMCPANWKWKMWYMYYRIIYITLSGCPHIFATLVLLYILLSGSMCLFTRIYKTNNFNISRYSCVSFRIQHKSNENLIFYYSIFAKKNTWNVFARTYVYMCVQIKKWNYGLDLISMYIMLVEFLIT